MIYELDHWWGGDLSVDNTGDLLLASGTQRGEQRVLRRLMTNSADETQGLAGDYLWDQAYGGSLSRDIGKPLDIGKTGGRIRSTMTLETVVAKAPPPQIAVAQLPVNAPGFSVQIAYEDAPSNTPIVLAFNVTP